MREIFRKYLEDYSTRNLENLHKTFSSTATGIGTGEDEIALSGETFRKLYERDLEQVPDNLVFDVI